MLDRAIARSKLAWTRRATNWCALPKSRKGTVACARQAGMDSKRKLDAARCQLSKRRTAACAREKRPHKFLVLSSARSGSSYVVEMLDSHPEVCCGYELLIPQ